MIFQLSYCENQAWPWILVESSLSLSGVKPLNLNRYRKIFSKKNHLKKHLTKYAPESLTLIIFFVKKYNTEIRNYLVNLNVTFIYLLYPIMLLSQMWIEFIMKYKVAKIRGYLIQIIHLSHKEFLFGKNKD